MNEAPRAYKDFDLAALESLSRYKLLTSAIIPRPIAWVTTRSTKGVINAAPFSQFLVVSYDPPLLAISVAFGKRKKDTQRNIEDTGEFVVNTVPEHAAELIQKCSNDYPPDVSEVEELGLKLLPSQKLSVPRLAISAVHFECRLKQMIEVGDSPNQLIIGDVVLMHVEQKLIHDQKIDAEAYRTLARIGGRNYLRFGEIVTV
jgi:flavin reductase (DIM6/NTAB) family NADH-FMN oxidoreductase RutF